LYGLYQGVPLTQRTGGGPLLPDLITIFQEPLERDFPGRAALNDQIRRTLLHEIAHFFGISDARLHELDAY
jgi:predicted Zn-dependent protease with MMP-like domain